MLEAKHTLQARMDGKRDVRRLVPLAAWKVGSGPATVASAPAVANEMMNEKTHEGVSFIFLGQLLMALG